MKFPRALRSLALIALLFCSTAAFAIESYTIHLNSVNGAATRYVSPHAVRYVVPAKNQDMIFLLGQDTVIHLDHSSRSYSEVKLADVRRLMAGRMAAVSPQQRAMMHQMGLDAPPTVTKLGPGEMVAGYATERYLVKTGLMQMEVFAAPQLQVPSGYYDVLGIGAMDRLLGSEQRSQLNSIAGCVLKQVATGRSRTTMPGRTDDGELVTAVDVSPVPASQFAIPPGYKKREFQMTAGRD
jgi:hypothetical protein